MRPSGKGPVSELGANLFLRRKNWLGVASRAVRVLFLEPKHAAIARGRTFYFAISGAFDDYSKLLYRRLHGPI
jgi:hypothetical protein